MSASSLSLWQLAHGEAIDRDLWPDWTPAPTGRVVQQRTPEYLASVAALQRAQKPRENA